MGIFLKPQAVGGVLTFLGLTDTPLNYVGLGSLAVTVNVAENALEFTDSFVRIVGDTMTGVLVGFFLTGDKSTILATAPAGVSIAFATDSLELMIWDGASWQVAPIELNTENDDPDMGIDRFELVGDPIVRNDSSGYYRDWITDKNLSNVRILQNALIEEGAIRTTTAGVFQIYLNGVWNDVVVNFVLREDSDGAYEFEHKPIGFTEWIEIMSGNSDKLDLGGKPIIQQYASSMGAFQVDVAIDGGSF